MTTTEQIWIERGDQTQFMVTWNTPSDATQPIFLIIPAMGVGSRLYRRFRNALKALGYGVAVTEQRGHEAVRPSVPGFRRNFGYAELADDLDAAIYAVRERAPLSPLILVGHSLGAQIAGLTLARHMKSQDAAHVKGLVFIAAGTVYWRLWSQRFLPLSQSLSWLATIVGHFPGKRLGFAGREARGVMQDWARLARTGKLTYGRRPVVDAGPELAKLELPILMISMEGDKLAPQTSADGLLALFPSAHVSRQHLIIESEKSSHFGWALEPESTVREIQAWITEQNFK